MNKQIVISKKKEILARLSTKQVKEAFEELLKLAVNMQDWHISEKLSDLETNYKLMLHYQFEGSEDPQREFLYNNLLRSLYEITDDVTDELLAIESSNLFYERLRINSLKKPVHINEYYTNLKELSENLFVLGLSENEQKQYQVRDLAIKRERIGSEMFMSIFVSPRSNEDDFKNYLAFLTSYELPSRDKCLFISALTLNLLHRFDSYKAQILMEACKNQSAAINQRAIIGLIIVLQMYPNRWEFYTECQQLLDVLSESSHFKKSVLTIIKQLIRSRETEKISKRLTEEIIPEMMKFNSLSGKKINMEDLIGESDFADKNPDWKKELEDSGLADKLQEYSSLQMEGADVFHSTFSNLKNFPFFSEISNWFLPFDPAYSELINISAEGDKQNSLYTAILDSGQMCDSDKYSFSFSLMQIPPSQREMMISRFGAESEDIKELQKDVLAVNPSKADEIISNQYIQNLYRFFKLNLHRRSFFDIFTLKLNFYDKKALAPLIAEPDSMRQIAHYCFDKNYFAEALDVYSRLASLSQEDADVYQKIAYCKQMLEDLSGALEAYLQADLIAPNNSWTIRRIAHIYRSLKKPELALEYYQKVSLLNPNNLATEMNIGHCYLELKEYEKALNYYFKIELLDAKTTKAWRPIAWTAFLLRKFDISKQYYEQILANKPTVHDYMNAGHVELCLGNMKHALSFYKQAIVAEGNIESFVSLYKDDREALVEVGIKDSFFPLLFDQLRYELD